MKKILIFGIVALVSTQTFAQSSDDINMFPKPEANKVQKVIQLNPLENEEDFMVEVMIGKKTMTDGCNNYFLIGKLEEKNLEGWGYNYYTFESEGNIASTLMGCFNTKGEEKVVYAETTKVRYNSRLPIVIYAPKDVEVNYRIWKADTTIHKVK